MVATLRATFAAVLICSFAAPRGLAELITYELTGHIDVQTTHPSGDWMGLHSKPFTARLSYDLSPDKYSHDWQDENPRFGQYRTLAPGTSLSLSAGELDFESDPSFYSSLFIINDQLGLTDPPERQGDYFRIRHRATLSETVLAYSGPINLDGGNLTELELEPWTIVHPYLLELIAKDSTKSVFSDDLLKTAVEFGGFDDLRIRITPVIPVSGSDPPRQYDYTVDAVVQSIRVVPEPSAWVLNTLGIGLCLLGGARRVIRPVQR